MKMKHNKRRNTAFLFEAIVKELTKAALKNDHKGKKEATAVLKEFFNKGSILAKELELYKALYETRATKEKEAEKILKEVKRVYSGLNHSGVFQAQSKLITKVNKNLNSGVFDKKLVCKSSSLKISISLGNVFIILTLLVFCFVSLVEK